MADSSHRSASSSVPHLGSTLSREPPFTSDTDLVVSDDVESSAASLRLDEQERAGGLPGFFSAESTTAGETLNARVIATVNEFVAASVKNLSGEELTNRIRRSVVSHTTTPREHRTPHLPFHYATASMASFILTSSPASDGRNEGFSTIAGHQGGSVTNNNSPTCERDLFQVMLQEVISGIANLSLEDPASEEPVNQAQRLPNFASRRDHPQRKRNVFEMVENDTPGYLGELYVISNSRKTANSVRYLTVSEPFCRTLPTRTGTVPCGL
jgi:hypothetical protein